MKKLSKLTASQAPISFVNKARLTAALLLIAAGLTLAALVVSSEAAPFIYVANTAEDTVSKIDVTSNTEVARFAAWFTSGSASYLPPRGYTQGGPCPSRIARDIAKNAYFLDRFFPYAVPPSKNVTNHLPVLFKIDASPGSPTSTGGSNVLAITDSGTGNNHIDPGEVTDKAIAWAAEIGTPASGSNSGDEGALGRALCVDTTGNLWVGMYWTMRYYKVNPATGAVILGPVSTPNHHPYGCQVAADGKLWSIDGDKTLAEIDTNSGAFVPPLHDHGTPGTGNPDLGTNYAISIFNDCSKTPAKITVYLSNRYTGKTYIAYDPQTNSFTKAPATLPQLESWSIAVDSQGNIFSADNHTGRVIKVSPAGTLLYDTNTTGPTQPSGNLHGLIVDENDDVWAVNCATNGQVFKYSGANLTHLGTVNIGAYPYTYGNTPPGACSGNTGQGTDDGGCAPIKGDPVCLPNGDYSYTFTVTNNTGHGITRLLLTPLQGSTVTLSPQLANFSTPVPNGQSTTLTTTIGGAKAGDKVCFYVSLLADKEACCNKQVCLIMPKCGEASPTPTVTSSLPPTLRQQRPPPPSRRGKRRP